MRKLVYVFLFLGLNVSVFSQVPNSSFENWSQADPVDWGTTNVPGVLYPVTQSSDAHSGSSAVKGEVLPFFTTFIAPAIQAGEDATGFAISSKYTTFKGYFKFAPLEGDRLSITVGMYVNLDSAIGIGAEIFQTAIGSYTEVTVPINYFAPGDPTICIINASIIGPVVGNDYHAGSIFYADDFSLSGTASDINDPSMPLTFKVDQNYPNPFNPSTTIKYSIPEAGNVLFSVFNSIGKEVFKESYFKNAGEHFINFSAEGLSSGVYFYSIRSGKYISTKKFTVIK